MPIDQIVSLLIAERDRLNRAIQALQTGSKGPSPAAKRPGRATAAPAAGRRRKPMSPAQKKAHSERMKAFWAERRKQAKKA